MLRRRHSLRPSEITAQKQRRARFQQASWPRKAIIIIASPLRDFLGGFAFLIGIATWLWAGFAWKFPNSLALLLGIGASAGIYALADYLLDRVEDRLD